ncbi:hypothetical protein [Corynebacterium marinum]|uniref:hypothetical protein n=1 Tax=Corynebacterium marinum TaxID=349751 RepID=UPI0012EB66E5|nr:hypothetical protein [Corynebacterium marinum]GGO22510.1 hypothetical protein GCM10010980_24680 [Corynebacterium marinum]
MTHDPNQVNYQAFRELARSVLEEEANRLLEQGFAQFSSLESRWHPNGFAVFHLNDHHELGNLRLHIWPDTRRVSRPDGAPIHTHAWHLCSRVLAGTYTETIYEEAVSETVGTRHYYRGTIKYLKDKNSVTDPGTSLLKPTIEVEATEGKYHEVAAGIPHETSISDGEFTATLLITSPPILEKVHVYSPEEINPSSYHRPALTSDEKMSLLHHLERQTVLNKGATE